MNYSVNNNDLLLVFRKANSKDVEFDIGSVSNYLNLAAGTVLTVNYDTNLVRANFNNSFNGVSFILAATTSDNDLPLRVWATDADLIHTPNQLTVNEYSTLSAAITSIGNTASANTGYNPGTPWVVSSTDANAYSYIVSPGNPSGIPSWNGNMNFTVENTSGHTLAFYELKLNPSTPPASLVGSFTMATNGILTFTAGPLSAAPTPSRIAGLARTNGVCAIRFTTTNGVHYLLRYSADQAAPLASWPTNTGAGTVTGDNTIKTFTDTTADPQRFYLIQSY
jgi:hypothetical protein